MERVIFIEKLSDKNKLIIFSIFLLTFFIISSIWYFNKEEEAEKLVIAKNIKEISTVTEINIGLYNADAIEDIDSIQINNENIRYISNLVYNSLFEYNNNMLESKLVKEFSKISEKSYVLILKDNIQFHTGKNLSSKDVKDTIEKIFLNENSFYVECVDNIQSVKIIDNLTLRINLIEAEDEFQENLIFPIMCEDMNIGTNEYKIGEFNQEKIILENIKTGQVLNIFIYDNIENLYSDFKNKKLDMIKSVQGIEYKNYIGEFGYEEKNYKGNECMFLEFNIDKSFRDSKLKEAFLAGINIKEIIARVFNNNACDIKDIQYDLDRVVEILEEQKYIYKDDGWYYKEKILFFEILLNKNLLTNLQIAYIIKEQLEKVGIKIELVIVEEDEYNKKVELKEYDILILNFKSDFYMMQEIKNVIICNKLSILYSLNLSGKIEPSNTNIFNDISTWKKII